MTSLNYDIQDKLKRLTVFEKIIAVNIAVYVLGWLITAFSAVSRGNSLAWLALPKDFSEFIFKPWSILTYGFTHIDFGIYFLMFLFCILLDVHFLICLALS